MNRLVCSVFLLMTADACRGLDRAHFEKLDGAGRAIESAVAAKSSLPQFRVLVATLSTELSDAKARMETSRERTLLAQYESAHTGLTDLLLVWEAREARGSDLLPISEELPARIAREYDLGINTNEPPSMYASEAMQTIWAGVKEKLDSARRTLRD